VRAVNVNQTLLLAPSVGLGGGIERYVDAIAAALGAAGVDCRRLNLREGNQPLTALARLRFARAVRRMVADGHGPMRLVIAHVNLLPVLALVARHPNYAGASVIIHGGEIWSGHRMRGQRRLRSRHVRVAAVSNFSAGALARTCRANVLPPLIDPQWFDTLVRSSELTRPPDDQLHLVTAFRLQSWRSKGLDTIIEAAESLDTSRIRLTVCGTGPVPPSLTNLTGRRPWCRILPDLTDHQLAEQFALADLFVLATRTRAGADASGEGFGLVILEAQLTGTPVVAPAYAGSGDAFQPGMTGVAPIDETPRALAAEIGRFLEDDKRRRAMGEAAATWARTRFSPHEHRGLLVRTLLA